MKVGAVYAEECVGRRFVENVTLSYEEQTMRVKVSRLSEEVRARLFGVLGPRLETLPGSRRSEAGGPCAELARADEGLGETGRIAARKGRDAWGWNVRSWGASSARIGVTASATCPEGQRSRGTGGRTRGGTYREGVREW